MVTKIHEQSDLVKAIIEIAATMPIQQTVQLYEFARFLELRSTLAGETLEDILDDEAKWDAQFAETDDDRLAAMVASVKTDIREGKMFPMFDEEGEFVERK